MTDIPHVRRRMQFECGRLSLGQYVRAVRDYLHTTDLDYDVQEDKGWLTAVVRITIEGPEAEVDQALETLDHAYPVDAPMTRSR